MNPESIFGDVSLDCEIGKDSIEELHKMLDTPKDITEKMLDVHNYMAVNRIGKMVLKFDSGIKFICEVDATEWKDPPKIDLDELLKGDKDDST